MSTGAVIHGPQATPEMYPVWRYGIYPDGTDCTTALNALMVTVVAAGGGVIQFAPGTYRCDGQLIQPASTGQYSKPIRLVGVAGWSMTVSPVVPGGTVIELRYTHATAPKILAANAAVFGLENITFSHPNPTGGASGPMALYYWACPVIQNCTFYTSQTSAWTVDALVFGGATPGSGNSTGFQGYGGIVEKNSFAGIRRCGYFRCFANGIRFINNSVWLTCGGTAAIEIDGNGQDASGLGNRITGNLIEGEKYAYAAKVVDGTNNYFDNDVFDTGAMTACYRAETAAVSNVFTGHFDGVVPFRSEATANANIWLPTQRNLNEPARTNVPTFCLGNVSLENYTFVTLTNGTGSGAYAVGMTYLDEVSGAFVRHTIGPTDGTYNFSQRPDANTGEVNFLVLNAGLAGNPIITIPATLRGIAFYPSQTYSQILYAHSTAATSGGSGSSGVIYLATDYWSGSASVEELVGLQADHSANSAGKGRLTISGATLNVTGGGIILPSVTDASVANNTLYFSSDAAGALSVKISGVAKRVTVT